jgi:hypothetical protein
MDLTSATTGPRLIVQCHSNATQITLISGSK